MLSLKITFKYIAKRRNILGQMAKLKGNNNMGQREYLL